MVCNARDALLKGLQSSWEHRILACMCAHTHTHTRLANRCKRVHIAYNRGLSTPGWRGCWYVLRGSCWERLHDGGDFGVEGDHALEEGKAFPVKGKVWAEAQHRQEVVQGSEESKAGARVCTGQAGRMRASEEVGGQLRPTQSNTLATRHPCLLSTWYVASETKELNLKFN